MNSSHLPGVGGNSVPATPPTGLLVLTLFSQSEFPLAATSPDTRGPDAAPQGQGLLLSPPLSPSTSSGLTDAGATPFTLWIPSSILLENV